MRLSAPAFWRRRTLFAKILYPLSGIFSVLVAIRRWCYRRSILKSWKSPVPVIIVGNISVGGAGKTPLVIALVEHLARAGRKPGIVTRGYGGDTTSHLPVMVDSASDPLQVGDEALMLARRTHMCVVASRDRPAAVQKLLLESDCDVVVCDDGLQHYALQRDIEIVVVDAEYRFGNGYCLPAGPLREPVSRIKEADLVVYSGQKKKQPGYVLKMEGFISHDDKTMLSVDEFILANSNSPIHAIAAIAYPQKFFNTLISMGLELITHEFPDHHVYRARDMQFSGRQTIVMTEKDKVKCESLALENAWYLKVSAIVDATILAELDQQLAIADRTKQSKGCKGDRDSI